MGIRKALVVLGMLGFSWLIVIGAVYTAIELYRVFLP
jgi:hypothetical protein